MNMTRRSLLKALSIAVPSGTLANVVLDSFVSRAGWAQDKRILTVNTVANALGIHIPGIAAIFEVLPSMPGYGVPQLNRIEHHRTMVQTLMAGAADFANPDPLTVFRSVESGSDLKIIGFPAVGTSLVFVVNADVIKDFPDLAKPDIVVAVNSKADATHVLLVGPLLKRGVDLKKVTIVEIGGSAGRMRALLSKRVHAVPMHFDQAAEVTRQGNFKVLLDPAKEYRVWPHEVWAVSGAWLKKPENQRASVDFMKAMITAHRRANTDFAWYANMYRKYSTLPKAAEATDEQIRPFWQALAHEIKAWPPNNNFSIEPFRELMPTFMAAEAIKGTVKLEQVIDTSYVEQALKELRG